MSASNANNGAGTLRVTCETSDGDQIPVDLDELRLSHTFKKMYDDLGLQEHDAFPGVFPVRTVSTRVFRKVIDWCEEHKDAPEPVIEKDPLTQECKWFTFTESERRFFDEWVVLELLELIMAANYLDIPRLYHYACQSVADRIKGMPPRAICETLQQRCDLDQAQIRKILDDNPWLKWPGALPCASIENAIFIPNEVLLTIFEKLPREDLDRLQLVSTQFHDVIVSSTELSEQQGPLRVVPKLDVIKLEFVAYWYDYFPQKIGIVLRDGTRLTSTDCQDLAKRLKFAIVQKLRLGHVYQAAIRDLSALLPVKWAWKNATVEAFVECFPSSAEFEFAFTELLLCKEIVLDRERPSLLSWSPLYMRLPAIVACNKLDISRLNLPGDRIQPTDVVEWLEHENPPERKWSEPRHLTLHEDGVTGGIDGLLTVLKTSFSASSSLNPYVLRILLPFHRRTMHEELANETTHELLTIHAEPADHYLLVKRA
ncbi:S-phase kinase-associated protein 1A [Aphelenchoides avenae]|nr:S-phase kinase-associated protein 1A [Aphelenchus avenae]